MAGCIDRGLDEVQAEQETIRGYVKDIEEVAATLKPEGQTCAARQEKFEELIERFERTQEPIHQQMVQVMTSFVAGLFVGEGKFDDSGKRIPLDVKKGDRILIGKYAGTEIKIEDEEYLILREDEVLAIVETK